MTGQQEAKDREKAGMKEGQKGPDLKEGAVLEEGLKELPVQEVKDQDKGRHLETGHKAEVVFEGIAAVILVNAEVQVAPGLEPKADPDHNGHIMIVLKVEEETKADRKKLFFKRTGALQKASF
mgnify:CR=1 FL=1